MKILARHLTADLYKCKTDKLADFNAAKEAAHFTLQNAGRRVLSEAETSFEDNFSLAVIFADGHITLHIYPALRHVSADIFLCGESAEPERLFIELRQFFKPEKSRITVLKRGDFKTNGDMKPKTKTRVAPLRKIRNTGAKVIRTLSGYSE